MSKPIRTNTLRQAQGEREGFVALVPAEVDVQAIRKAHKQEAFARTYGFSLASIRDWEQGRRQPERAARILLAMTPRNLRP
ncbi:helix-turn-helix domain-containing protein [Sphingomonas cavernae]|uniref:helix-turn-helix domain-containing protein n=1 Tax=Sphingomonas cavernae TaxID=2320861 RepID=UPI001C71CB1F|nr:hypothetical protein [Sphingomonas cavernae]